METVFEISLTVSELPNLLLLRYFLVFIGSISLIAFLVGRLTKLRFSKRGRQKIFAGMFISVISMFVLPSALEIQNWESAKLQDYYFLKHQLVKGVIKVHRLQPSTGHAPGDLIEVAGEMFEISYSPSNPFYSIPANRGGILKEGLYVELYHVKNRIFRIDHKTSKR